MTSYNKDTIEPSEKFEIIEDKNNPAHKKGFHKPTIALTEKMFHEYIDAMTKGGCGFRANPKIVTALIIEGMLGIRISDVLKLRLSSIVQDGERKRLDIVEKKTKKVKTHTVPEPVYQFIKDYCDKNNIGWDEPIIKCKTRNIQTYINKVTDYLGYSDYEKNYTISTHSFRKFFGTSVYYNNEHDIVLVQQLYQHANIDTTRKYINVSDPRVDKALEKQVELAGNLLSGK